MSLLKRLLGKSEPPKVRVRVCVECGMPLTEHKDWCAIHQQHLERKAPRRQGVALGRVLLVGEDASEEVFAHGRIDELAFVGYRQIGKSRGQGLREQAGAGMRFGSRSIPVDPARAAARRGPP